MRATERLTEGGTMYEELQNLQWLRLKVAELQAECVDDPMEIAGEIAGEIAAKEGLLEALDSAIRDAASH
jgi:hypothetical protein